MSNQNTVSSESDQQQTGSPQSGEPVYLAVGRIGKPHGLNGEAILYLLTDFPERLKAGKSVYAGKTYQKLTLQSVRTHNRGLIVKFKNHDTTEMIDKFKNEYLYVLAENLPLLPEGEYYHHELLGMQVFDKNEHYYGLVTEILETGANDVYVVKLDDKEELVPALKENLINIDVKNKRMVIKPLTYYD